MKHFNLILSLLLFWTCLQAQNEETRLPPFLLKSSLTPYSLMTTNASNIPGWNAGITFDGTDLKIGSNTVYHNGNLSTNFVDLTSSQSITGAKTFRNAGGGVLFENSVDPNYVMHVGHNGGASDVFRFVPAVGGVTSTIDRLEYNYLTKTWNVLNGNFLIGGQTPLFAADLPRIGALTTTGSGDFNTILGAGWHEELLRGTDLNAPATLTSTSTWFHKWVIEFASQDGSGNITEILFPYYSTSSLNEGLFYRGMSGGASSAWYEIWGSGNDGAGSGMDTDLFHGQTPDYYLDYNNFTNTLWAQNGTNVYYNLGNVGLGTDTPLDKLDLSGSGSTIGIRFRSGSGNTGHWTAGNFGGGYWGLTNQYNGTAGNFVGRQPLQVSRSSIDGALSIEWYGLRLKNYNSTNNVEGGVPTSVAWLDGNGDLKKSSIENLATALNLGSVMIHKNVYDPSTSIPISVTTHDSHGFRVPTHLNGWKLIQVYCSIVNTGDKSVTFQIDKTTLGGTNSTLLLGTMLGNSKSYTGSPNHVVTVGDLLALESNASTSGTTAPQGLEYSFVFSPF